jgi:hypothetical protein
MTSVWRRARSAVRRRRALAAAWQRLSARERREFLEFIILIPAARVTLLTAGFRRCAEYGRPAATASALRDPDVAASLTSGLRRAARFGPYRGNCLSQSLSLLWALRRRGIDADLRLGARMTDGMFSAHAWVERRGRVLNDTPDVTVRFAPFRRLTAPSDAEP